MTTAALCTNLALAEHSGPPGTTLSSTPLLKRQQTPAPPAASHLLNPAGIIQLELGNHTAWIQDCPRAFDIMDAAGFPCCQCHHHFHHLQQGKQVTHSAPMLPDGSGLLSQQPTSCHRQTCTSTFCIQAFSKASKAMHWESRHQRAVELGTGQCSRKPPWGAPPVPYSLDQQVLKKVPHVAHCRHCCSCCTLKARGGPSSLQSAAPFQKDSRDHRSQTALHKDTSSDQPWKLLPLEQRAGYGARESHFTTATLHTAGNTGIE